MLAVGWRQCGSRSDGVQDEVVEFVLMRESGGTCSKFADGFGDVGFDGDDGSSRGRLCWR